MKSFRVLSALYDEASGCIEVVKEITEDDDSTSLNLHIFGPETLEWRAAEYDMDDVDEVLEVVLYEPFIGEVNPLQQTVEAAKTVCRARVSDAKRRLTTNKANDKEEHKGRLRQAGVADKYVVAADEDPLLVLKRHCLFDAEVIDVKRVHISSVRETLKAERERVTEILAAKPKPSGAERAAALKQSLSRMNGDNNSAVRAQAAKQPRRTTTRLATVELEGKGRAKNK